MIKKRIQPLWLAIVFALSVVVPVRQANAVVPLMAYGLAVQAFGAGGSMLSSNLLAAAGSSLIGGTIVALAITPSSLSDGTSPVPVRIPLTTDQAKTDAAMPPPVAPAGVPITPGVTPVDVTASTSVMRCYAVGSPNNIAGPNVSCGVTETWSACAAWTVSAVGGVCVPVSNTSEALSAVTGNFTGTTPGKTLYRTADYCAAGYSLSGGTCVLTNPVAAVQDNKVDYKRDSTGVVTASDADASKASGYSYVPGTGQITVYGQDTNNAVRVITVGKDSSGNTTISTYAQTSAAGGTSIVNSQVYTLSGSTGQVLSVTGANSTGSISLAGSAPAITTGTTAGVVDVAGSGAGTGSQSLVLPTDYARAGEAANAASSINTKLDVLHRDLTEKGADVSVPVSPEASAFSNAFFNGTFGNLLAWRLPSHTSECPTVTFDYMMFTSRQRHVMDAQCTIAEQIRPVFSVVMVVVWTIVALFVLLGA